MPNRAKGPRLHKRTRKDGPWVWEIRDTNTRPISTRTQCLATAEEYLAEYISRKARPSGPAHPSELTISWALTIYADEHAEMVADPARIAYAIDALDDFWQEKTVSEVTGKTCRRYVKYRRSQGVRTGTIRRELVVLRSALNYNDKEGYLTSAPKVTLPPNPPARDRHLTRQEVAWLIRGARALNQDGRHLQWFVLDAVYSGSRKSTILAMHINTPSPMGGHYDLDAEIMYRKPKVARETNKQRKPAGIPPSYLAHLKRRHKNGARYVVEREMIVDGTPQRTMVKQIRKGWARAVELAEQLAQAKGVELDLTYETEDGPQPIVPHLLKHTAITWTIQAGAEIADVASYFSTSIETIQKVYWHHSPRYQSSAIKAAGGKRKA